MKVFQKNIYIIENAKSSVKLSTGAPHQGAYQ